MKPIRLSDDELSQIMVACQPLRPEDRDSFVRAVAASLQTCGEIGPGNVYRAIEQAQRAHFDPPADLPRGRNEKQWR